MSDLTLKTSQVKMQVLQKKEYDYVPYFSCRIHVTLLITHCGMFDHASMARAGLKSYIETGDRETCTKIGQFGIYSPRPGIVPNTTFPASITLAGSLCSQSDCEGETFYIGSESYTDVTVVASYEILYKNGYTLLDLAGNQIV